MGRPVQLIQVSLDLASPQTLRRETAALLKGAEELHCEQLLLITLYEKRDIEQNGHRIRVMPVLDWLFHPDGQTET